MNNEDKQQDKPQKEPSMVDILGEKIRQAEQMELTPEQRIKLQKAQAIHQVWEKLKEK